MRNNGRRISLSVLNDHNAGDASDQFKKARGGRGINAIALKFHNFRGNRHGDFFALRARDEYLYTVRGG